jgi:recombination protein RecA
MQTLAHQLRRVERLPVGWSCAALAGRFTELSSLGAGSALTVALGLIHQVQQQGEPAAWIAADKALFYPPDVAAGGVDLAALAVIRASGAQAAARAADKLLRSGAFGAVILDLGANAHVPMPLQSRLAALAQEYQSLLLCLTQKPPECASLSALVSLRGQAQRDPMAWTQKHEYAYLCRVQIIKDKRSGPGWLHEEVCRAAPGLC